MNNTKLIYLYILFLALCLLSSCTSDTPDTDLSGGAEVSFDVSDKARAATATLKEFAVFGDTKFPVDDANAPAVLFNNTKVEYKDGKWSYDHLQYWYPQSEHSFVAVSPLSVLGADINPQYLNSKLSFAYSIPRSAGDNSVNSYDLKDIVVATHRRLYHSDDPNSTIIFRFGHIMSLINISPALDDNSMSRDEYIKIHKLEFSGVKVKARFDILPASRLSGNQTDDMIVEVNEQEEGNFTIGFATSVKVLNDSKNVSLFADNNAIIMLPQDFAGDSAAEIILDYTVNEESTMQQISVSLNNLKWDSAKSYLYKFTIEKKAVKFENCEITPWNVIQGEEITVD